MKLKVFFTTLLCILCAGIFFIPSLVTSILPSVSIIKMQPASYTKTVTASGTLEEAEKRDLYTDLPVIATPKVQPGDIVTEGQELASVDVAATLNALKEIDLSEIDLSGLDYSDLLSSFGGSITSIDQVLELLEDRLDTGSISFQGIPTSIKSPISGIVQSVGIEEGKLTEIGAPVITVVKNKGLVAKVSISESDIHEVSLGNKVTLSGQAFGSKTYSGTVAAIETSAKKSLFSTSQEAVVEATISLRDPDDSLKAGYSVKAKIVTGDTKDVSIVPYEAVMQDDLQNEYVYVYENSKVYKQYIETGLELANGIEVTEGLTADSYIVETPERVREDGEQVMVFQNKSP